MTKLPEDDTGFVNPYSSQNQHANTAPNIRTAGMWRRHLATVAVATGIVLANLIAFAAVIVAVPPGPTRHYAMAWVESMAPWFVAAVWGISFFFRRIDAFGVFAFLMVLFAVAFMNHGLEWWMQNLGVL